MERLYNYYCLSLTSSGSISLNSMPLPVQVMAPELAGSSRSVTKNCQSCSDPLLVVTGNPGVEPPGRQGQEGGEYTGLANPGNRFIVLYSRTMLYIYF